MRINSIQRHASAHSLPQGKVGRCHSEHSARRSCQVRRVGKAGTVSSCGYTGPSHQVAAGPLETEPEDIRPEGNSRRLSENEHETRLREPEIAANVFSEKSLEIPSLSRRCLSTTRTQGESSPDDADEVVVCGPIARRVLQ